MKFLGLVLVAMVGCTSRNAAVCDATNPCVDEARPYCDLDGSISGQANECIAVDCTPGEAAACSADKLLTCNASGTDYDAMACPFGCADAMCNGCSMGDTSCSADGNLNTCQADGTNVESSCAQGCTNGACNPCDAGTVRCGDDNVVTCGADGTESVTDTCLAGCTTDGGAPRCKYLQPQFAPDVCDTPATADLTISTNHVLSTADCNGGITTNATTGDQLCILRYRSVTLAAGSNLTAPTDTHGAAAHITFLAAIAIVADSQIEIDGTIDVGGKGLSSGPGYHADPDFGRLEGIGGGGRTTGGTGCSFSYTVNQGDSMVTDTTLANTLRAGHEGGDQQTGGGAGGAITLIACRGSIKFGATGAVLAGGGGGVGDATEPGGGGGGGGTIVLQGLAVEVTDATRVAANGGGGAPGSHDTGTTAGDGGLSPGAGGGNMNGSVPANTSNCFANASNTPGSGGGGAAGFVSANSTTVPATLPPGLTLRAATLR